jgi:hypothetical protein
MAFSLTWLPAVLLEAGLKVAEVPGWQSRGRAEMGSVLGAMVHHTVGPPDGNMPSLRTLIDGRSDLSGPLAQLGLGRDGTWYVISAGRANHAGKGEWRRVSTGNSNFIGIECENTGRPDDLPWPAVQMLALRQGVAALLRHAGRSADWCMGHREYALPRGRKPDPLFDMDAFRSELAATLAAGLVPLPPIPAIEPPAPPVAGGPALAPRPTLRRGSAGPLVVTLQQALGIEPADGVFGPQTEAAVRRAQRSRGLVPDGIVGPKSWAALSR